jgi:amino acid transporter
MPIADLLIGRPLATTEERAEHVGPSAGVSIFGLDALSSAAYGPEAALTLLIPLGLGGVHYIIEISAAIIALLIIVYFSYRQTIEAYPNGGGSYTVATENLGDGAGLLAAAALMIDYVLTAAVGISAGVGALVSALPSMHAHVLALCLGILALLTLVNMRGVRDTGIIILAPTYLFVLSLLTMILIGLYHTVATGGHPVPVLRPPHLPAATEALSFWLLLRVFSSGCTAMTGVEAVSNGVTAFGEPRTDNAKKTLSIIILILIALLAGIAFLCHVYNIGATDPNSAQYESVLSQLLGAVAGRGIFYYVSIASILLVLALSANTAFADFPRLTRAVAANDFLPHVFTLRGRRLLYSWGVYVLVGLTAVLLILFGGVTDRLIPLYAIGAFMAFTLSQAGMVVHWQRVKGARWLPRMVVNAIGAVATGITLIVVLVTKFVEGAWITALLVPCMILLMVTIRRHYRRVAAETRLDKAIHLSNLNPPRVIVPVDQWSRITEKGLRFALTISPDVQAVHIDLEEGSNSICDVWEKDVAAPLRAAKMKVPELVRLKSPYRFVLLPIVEHVLAQAGQFPNQRVAVIVPELVVNHWYENLLHNQRANVLKLLLLVRGNRKILVINIPWYL